MIESIQFKNFKALRDTTLPLGPFTVLVGPNGSGKSTVLQALEVMSGRRKVHHDAIISADLRADDGAVVEVCLKWGAPFEGMQVLRGWRHDGGQYDGPYTQPDASVTVDDDERSRLNHLKSRIRIYSLDAIAIAAPVKLQRDMELAPDGAGLAGVLTRLQDREPERFEGLNEELSRWLPEFDRILFDVDTHKQRVFLLRTCEGHHAIPAVDLSQGTLLALSLLTLAYLPDPSPLIGLEEPDRGIHPRLLRRVQDTLYRLSHPESCGEQREPVQVIATTHSPYFLDLFKDHPEEVVIANKVDQDVKFERLSEQPHIQEMLQDSHLGDIWYTGILGGVPCEP